jgi:hypothetical protein
VVVVITEIEQNIKSLIMFACDGRLTELYPDFLVIINERNFSQVNVIKVNIDYLKRILK